MPRRIICILLFVAATLSAMAQGSLAGYEYWIDSGYDSRVAGVGNGEDVTLDIDIPQASAGIHYLNFRGCNSQQEWGPVYRYLFFVTNALDTRIARYECWLDGAYDSRSIAAETSDSLVSVIDIGNLTEGIHYYNVRCQNAEGEWGPLYRYVFFMPESIPTTTLTYWIDDETNVKTWKGNGNEFVVQTDISQLNGGRHVFHCQVANSESSTEYAYEFLVSDIDFNGQVLTVAGDINMAEALEQVGGRETVAASVAAVVWNSTTQLTNSDLQGISNPNLLVYVNEASLAPSGVQNVVINGQAREIVLTDATSGNNNFYAPQAFTAERISYTRNFGQTTQVGVSRGWEAIALPFSVQTITHEEKGAIAPFGSNASNRHFWLRQLGGNGLQTATSIEANTPYIISMPNSADYTDSYNLAGRVTFSAENAQVPATEVKTAAMADSSIVMMPTMQRVSRSSAVWALNVGEVRGSYLEGSVFERDYREVRPFEAYTVHRQENSQPAPRYVPVLEIGGATGISEMEDVRSKTDDAWYTTDGRKLQGKPAAKGVYINGNRKIVIR